jgi:hypothetical protein
VPVAFGTSWASQAQRGLPFTTGGGGAGRGCCAGGGAAAAGGGGGGGGVADGEGGRPDKYDPKASSKSPSSGGSSGEGGGGVPGRGTHGCPRGGKGRGHGYMASAARPSTRSCCWRSIIPGGTSNSAGRSAGKLAGTFMVTTLLWCCCWLRRGVAAMLCGVLYLYGLIDLVVNESVDEQRFDTAGEKNTRTFGFGHQAF